MTSFKHFKIQGQSAHFWSELTRVLLSGHFDYKLNPFLLSNSKTNTDDGSVITMFEPNRAYHFVHDNNYYRA